MSYTIEEFDSVKTKVLKYIMYKKRTEKEVRQKFSSSVDENLLDEVIENLKELGYEDIYVQGHSLGYKKIVYTYTI